MLTSHESACLKQEKWRSARVFQLHLNKHKVARVFRNLKEVIVRKEGHRRNILDKVFSNADVKVPTVGHNTDFVEKHLM